MAIKIMRFNPRKDTTNLELLLKDFEYRSIYPFNLRKFREELDKRNKSLVERNAIILAKNMDELIGAGFLSVWNDFLGNRHCIVHDVVVRKENSFKSDLKIEEKIIKEIFTYIKNTLSIDEVGLFAKKKDSNFQSVLMKLGVKKSNLDYYSFKL